MNIDILQLIKKSKEKFNITIPSGKIVFNNDLQKVTDWPVEIFEQFRIDPLNIDHSKVTQYYEKQNIGAIFFGDACPEIISSLKDNHIILENYQNIEEEDTILPFDEELELLDSNYLQEKSVDLSLWWLLFCDYEQYKTLHNLTDSEMENQQNISIVKWNTKDLTINLLDNFSVILS